VPDRPTSLLIEGWRGVSHSYGLINQYQILELLKLEGLQLFHTDLPFFNQGWNRAAHNPGFSAADQRKIDALPPPGPARIDCVYRIASPIPAIAQGDRRRAITFMITEMGLAESHFAPGGAGRAAFIQGENCIVTTTAWSRDRIAEFGFPPEKIQIIPCGADTAIFRPLAAHERRKNREALSLREDETVFANVGGAYWNKGADLLLHAFAILRARGRKARLMLKDQRGLYGVTVERIIANVGQHVPALLEAGTIAAISTIPGQLNRLELRALYGIANAYVSPYRAEGFNLPVLEAIACGTPVIVTAGGATDDFCPEPLASRIPGRFCTTDSLGQDAPGRYIEPDLDALVTAMDEVCTGRQPDPAGFEAARLAVLGTFNWPRAARDLAALVTGAPAVAAPCRPLRQQTSQEDVLDFIAKLRPRAMARTGKIRLGNEHDGGYVLPATVLACDAALSIGIGSDVSFDLQLAEQGATILQFDDTITAPPANHPNFRFYQLGWGARTTGTQLGFADLCAKLTPLVPRHPLLKFDIEGAEYEIFATLDAGMLEQFEVITCELHGLEKLGAPDFFHDANTLLEKLTRHHLPVHIHANNYAGVALVHGVPVPEVLELSFLRRDLDAFSPAAEPIPGALDRPNHPLLPDICLNVF